MTRTTVETHDDLFVQTHAGPAPAAPARGATPLPSPADAPGGPLLRPQRILVAGDDVLSLAGLVDAVSAPQREVHSTSCTELALELALQLHFDLVVLHLDHPGADAVEVSHCIRACHDLLQPTIVIVSRVLDEDSWTQAERSGADRVVAEPETVVDLTCALADVLL